MLHETHISIVTAQPATSFVFDVQPGKFVVPDAVVLRLYSCRDRAGARYGKRRKQL